MERFRVSKTSIGCGATVAALITIIQATGLLPESFQSPEVVSALTGLLTTLGAAFQVCGVRSPRDRSGKPPEEKV